MNSASEVDTYKLGWSSSKAVGVHTPRIRRSIILMKPPPLPERERERKLQYKKSFKIKKKNALKFLKNNLTIPKIDLEIHQNSKNPIEIPNSDVKIPKNSKNPIEIPNSDVKILKNSKTPIKVPENDIKILKNSKKSR